MIYIHISLHFYTFSGTPKKHSLPKKLKAEYLFPLFGSAEKMVKTTAMFEIPNDLL